MHRSDPLPPGLASAAASAEPHAIHLLRPECIPYDTGLKPVAIAAWDDVGKQRGFHRGIERMPDPFLEACQAVHNQLRTFEWNDEHNRSLFQAEVRSILEADPGNYWVLGEVRYMLQPQLESKDDWRRRDINRMLTRYSEDRPIQDARRWARFAVILASLALASSMVSAITDFPEAWSNVVKVFRYIGNSRAVPPSSARDCRCHQE